MPKRRRLRLKITATSATKAIELFSKLVLLVDLIRRSV
jgi:hypothetical protein